MPLILCVCLVFIVIMQVVCQDFQPSMILSIQSETVGIPTMLTFESLKVMIIPIIFLQYPLDTGIVFVK